MMIFLALVALSVVAVIVVGLAEKHKLIAPLQSEQTAANIKWVQDFNLALGMKLGGILGVFDGFSEMDVEDTLKKIVKYHDKEKSLLDAGKSQEEVATILAEDVVLDVMPNRVSHGQMQIANRRASMIADYITFYSVALIRLKEDLAFRSWVEKCRFSVQPDMMTGSVLKRALKEVCR